MKKSRLHIAVGVFTVILFITVTVAHACAGMTAAHGSHDHNGVLVAASVQSSHSKAQDSGCRSIRDRLLSLGAEKTASATLLTGAFYTMPAMVGRYSLAFDALLAERPPGFAAAPLAQRRLYFSESILRI